MKKAILISIHPEFVAKILNKEKTMEIRKTVPKCELPIDVYIYCTKGKYLFAPNGYNEHWWVQKYFSGEGKYNGKVVAKFKLDFVEKIYPFGTDDLDTELGSSLEELSFQSCVPEQDLLSYVGNGAFYWFISDLEIFDKPMELSDFGLKRAPQSWQYIDVEELE